jgi:hypothetical protein
MIATGRCFRPREHEDGPSTNGGLRSAADRAIRWAAGTAAWEVMDVRELKAGFLGIVVAVAGLAFVAPASAADFPVTNDDDSGDGSLRQAIVSANANANAPVVDTITITASGTVQLATPLQTISEPVEINGPGADVFTVRRDTGGAYKVLQINAGNVAIRGLTVRNGLSGDGAGINSGTGTLTLERVAVVGNASTQGNTSAGGGVFAQTIVLRESTISGNTANGAGGGIAAATGTIENSTISGNSAGLMQADATGGGARFGAAGSVITNSTFANNSTAGQGQSLYSFGVTLKNTLLAGAGNDCGGTAPTSQGFNLSDDASCNLNQATDQPGTDAQLGGLADNGGPTRTHALPLTSPAVDKGQADALSVDQRGQPRPVDLASVANSPGGNGADIGAFEFLPGGAGGDGGGGGGGGGAGDDANDFSFGKVKRNKRKGTAKLTVRVPGAGELDLAKTKKVKADDEAAEDAGKEKLSIKPRRKAKKKLNAKGRAKVKANVTYTPDGGTPNTEDKKIKLVKR